MTCEPGYAWACVWSNGKPRPFIMAHTTESTRSASQEHLGKVWIKEGETIQEGWKRAYRKGVRCIRVKVLPAFGGE